MSALDRLEALEEERACVVSIGGHPLWKPDGYDAEMRAALPALIAVARAAQAVARDAEFGPRYWGDFTEVHQALAALENSAAPVAGAGAKEAGEQGNPGAEDPEAAQATTGTDR